jgi:hypothetical protein
VDSAVASATEVPVDRSRLLTWYAVGQSAAIAGIFFVDRQTWLYHLWLMAVGWAAALGVFLGIRRQRPEGAVAWYLFGIGVFLAASGTMVETIEVRVFGRTTIPHIADAFYLALYPALLGGLGVLLYRQSARQTAETLVLSTAGCAGITVILGIFAWDFIVWRADTDHSLSLAMRMVIAAYPLADLLVISLMLRLFLGGGPRGPAVPLAAASQGCFLIADLAWMVVARKGLDPDSVTEHLLNMTSLTAYALVGAAALTPSIRTIVPAPERRTLSPIGWTTFAVSVLTGPLVLLAQALIDSWYHLTGL